MFAIVEYKGFQYKAEENKTLEVPFLADKNEGDIVEMDKVLLLNTDKETFIGQPTVESAKIKAEVIRHDRSKKYIIFKKKKRKSYRKKNGHRQPFTVLKIQEISQ